MEHEDSIIGAHNDPDPLFAATEFDVGSVKEKPIEEANHGRKDYNAAKRIELLLTKPSYTLTLAPENVRNLNRRRLQNLLFKLIKGRQWKETSEVLSILMRRTCQGRSLLDTRLKYWAAMELFRHKEGDNSFSNNISRLFDSRRNNAGRNEKEDLFVDLEFILYCLMQRNLEKATEDSIILKEDAKHRHNPHSNLVFGLSSFEVWYSNLPEDLKLSGYDVYCMSKETETWSAELHERVQNSEQDDSISVIGIRSHSHRDSETSIRNDKLISMDSKKFSKKRKKIGGLVSRGSPHDTFEVKEDEEERWNSYDDLTPDPSVFSSHGLKPSLLPLKLPDPEHVDDFVAYYGKFLRHEDYRSAKKCLDFCVKSSDPSVMEAALVPLIQLHLLGGRLDGALELLQYFCDTENTALPKQKTAQPFRIKAHLLECFRCGPNAEANAETNADLIVCYESIIKIDPSCEHSVKRLVALAKIGEYDSQKLLLILAAHLDCTSANADIWREFASCLLQISSSEDRMSIIEEQANHEHLNSIKKSAGVPARLTPESTWKMRYRGWLMRHFSKAILASEIKSGELELMACKAACAAHFYGPEFGYVVQARDAVREKGDDSVLSILQMHIENAVVLCPNPFQSCR